MKKNIF